MLKGGKISKDHSPQMSGPVMCKGGYEGKLVINDYAKHPCLSIWSQPLICMRTHTQSQDMLERIKRKHYVSGTCENLLIDLPHYISDKT